MATEQVPALAAAGWDDVALVMPANWQHSLSAALTEDWRTGTNRYELMERNGLFVVSPSRFESDGLILSGGSYSQVSLHSIEGLLVVRKRLALSGQLTRDRELRQIQEIDWLTRVPDSVGELFAPLVQTARDDAWLELATEFVFGYTLAELVFQGRLGAGGLAEMLEHVYAAVSSTIWTQAPVRPPVAASSESYVQRIRRRIETIAKSAYPAGGAVRQLLEARQVTVNGQLCQGVAELLEALDRSARWRHVVRPRRRTLCHGDLILEDILVSENGPEGFRLVDPNPANENPIYDVGKTMMSLWLGYELLYFDHFSIDWTAAPRQGFQLEIHTEKDEAQAVYRDAARSFMSYLEKQLMPHLDLPREDLEPSLRMSAAIHMLAITVFHLLHHRREERALAFAGTALLHAQAALDG